MALFIKTYEMYLDQVASLRKQTKCRNGRAVWKSAHLSYPARMMRKMRNLKNRGNL